MNTVYGVNASSLATSNGYTEYGCCPRANSMLVDNALTSMGAGLPSASASKIVHPGSCCCATTRSQENMKFPDYEMTLRNPDFAAHAQS